MVPETRPAVVRILVVVGLLAALAAAAAIPARATYGARVTADEPYYLLTAQSLAEDGSLDIDDELARRAYLPYHEVTVDEQTADLDGRRISPHDPLLPVVLAVPMALGGWVAAKATLSVVAGLVAALTAWIAIARFGVSARVAGVVVAAASVGVPLAPYGSQVYPELPAALAVLVGVAAVSSPRIATVLDHRRVAAAAGAAVVALPWLSVKYVPVAAVLAAVLVWRRARISWRSAAVVAGLLASAGVVYLVAHQVLYGGWTVYAAGDHFTSTGEFSVVGTEVDPLGRSRRLVGLLVDRDFGLVAWHPLWLLVAPALGALLRRRPEGTGVLVALVAVGWANATFVALTMHGWWFPGRQIVVVVPLLVVAVAVLVDRHRRLLVPAAAAGFVGAATWVHLAWEASTGRRTLIVDFTETAAPWHRLVRPVLADGLGGGTAADLVLIAWAVVLAAAAVWGYSLPSESRRTTLR